MKRFNPINRSLRAAMALALGAVLTAGILTGCGGSKAPAAGGNAPASTEKKDEAPASGGSEAAAEKPADGVADSAVAEWKPDQKTITFRLANAAGGTVDLKFRNVATAVQNATGVTAVVQNITGANGALMAADLDSYDPSPCELMVGTEALFAVAPVFGKDVQVSLDDYEILFGMPVTSPSVLAIRADMNIKTWDEFAAYAKDKTIKVACNARPGMTNIQGAALMSAAGIAHEFVTDGAANKNILTCMSGDADVVVANTAALHDYAAKGDLIPLVQFNKTPFKDDTWEMDPIPSVVDIGFADIAVEPTSFLCVRKGADPVGVEAMRRIIMDYLASDQGKADMAKINTINVEIPAAETYELMKAEIETFKMIKEKYVK